MSKHARKNDDRVQRYVFISVRSREYTYTCFTRFGEQVWNDGIRGGAAAPADKRFTKRQNARARPVMVL